MPRCFTSNGTKVAPEFFDALSDWSASNLKTIGWVTKGSNPLTEHYSGVQADVPDPKDPGTQLNTGLINVLTTADVVLIAGEASSHCVANTVRDIANNFGDDSYVQKMAFLEDASSPVPTFEQFTEDFIKEMTGRGMKITKTTEWMK